MGDKIAFFILLMQLAILVSGNVERQVQSGKYQNNFSGLNSYDLLLFY